MLESEIYQTHTERLTLYCNANFDSNKKITLPEGFVANKHLRRAGRVEWEHVVPAENFGRAFSEWREGHEKCENSKNQKYRGRRCANKINDEYRLMQADMYNLYPAIGAVNAMRSNFNFALLSRQKSSFGACEMKIASAQAEPPKAARGVIARAYLYMDKTYPKYSMSRQQRQLMNAWHRQYPVSSWECARAKRIAELQGNINPVLNESCAQAGYPH
ncbi:MAG TPA: endonuclease [Psychromonas sp.]